MSGQRRRYSPELKLEAVRRMENCSNIAALAAELDVRRKWLYLWREQFRKHGPAAFRSQLGRPVGTPQPAAAGRRPKPAPAGPGPEQRRIAELERLLGVKQLEVDVLRRTFEHVRGAMANPGAGGETVSGRWFSPASRSKEKV